MWNERVSLKMVYDVCMSRYRPAWAWKAECMTRPPPGNDSRTSFPCIFNDPEHYHSGSDLKSQVISTVSQWKWIGSGEYVRKEHVRLPKIILNVVWCQDVRPPGCGQRMSCANHSRQTQNHCQAGFNTTCQPVSQLLARFCVLIVWIRIHDRRKTACLSGRPNARIYT